MKFKRFNYQAQDFRFSVASDLQCIGTKHSNWQYRPVDDAFYQCAGDLGRSMTQSMAKLKFDSTARGYTFSELLSETEAMPSPLKRPGSPDDGFWYYCGANNSNPALRDKFIWARGGDGASFSTNEFTRQTYRSFAEDLNQWIGGSDANSPGAVNKMKADGWTMDKFVIYDPTVNNGKGGFAETNTHLWPCDIFPGDGAALTIGGVPNARVHPTLMGSAACRNGAFDPGTNTLTRFVNYNNNQFIVRYHFDTQRISMFTAGSWWHPDGRRIFLENNVPASADLVVEDVIPIYANAGNGRSYSAAMFQWEHKAMYCNPATGKTYVVAPATGVLWEFDTRAAPVTTPPGDEWALPFRPVGKRIPIHGQWPPTESHFLYPPPAFGGDVTMNSFLMPWRGGLLWASSGTYGHGVTGCWNHAFWRRLGNEGDWTPVRVPDEFSANSFAPKSYDINNDEIMCISQASTTIPLGYSPYFWKLTT